MNKEYTLTVIEDMETPLSAGPAGNSSFFGYAVIAVIFVICVLAVLIYMNRCSHYRRRLFELQSHHPHQLQPQKPGWNIYRLREMIMEEESQLAGILFDELVNVNASCNYNSIFVNNH